MSGKIENMKIVLLSICIAALLHIPAQAAQDPQFRLDMDSLNLQKGVSCEIVISMVNARDAKILGVEGLENFDLVSQSHSTSTSIINRETTYQDTIYYTVMPKTSGQFTLKAIIEYNGKTYETNPLQVTIGENAANEGQTVQDLFVKTVLSHSEAYLGEKVILSYELYTRYNIQNYGFTDYTSIDGVISKDTPQDRLKAKVLHSIPLLQFAGIQVWKY